MGEYLVRIVVLSFSFGLVTYLSYPSENAKAIKVATSVLLLSVVVSFIPTLVGDGLPELSQILESIKKPSLSVNDGELGKVAVEAFEEGVRELVSKKYGISVTDISVSAYGFDIENMRAEKIEIVLSGVGALADWRSIGEYVKSQGLGECEVNISLG